jgi:guanyl-specific ribonuclease Sa
LVADELGITAGLECFTTGDLGACGETALNVASMFVGGLAGKIAVKYGLRWGKAAELGRRIAALGGELIDGVNGLIRANRKVDNLCSPGNSFVPGTRVVMADGSTRPIEEVDVGEKVLATDPETGERTARTVLATIIGSGSKHLVEITVDPTTERTVTGENTGSEVEDEQVEQSGIPGPVAAGDVIIATDEHPFWVPDLGQWVDAVDLAPGTWLQTSSGTWVQVSAVQAWTQPATVHNLTVQGVHTFHVAAGDSDVLNHNTNSCPHLDLSGVEEHAKPHVEEVIHSMDTNYSPPPGVRQGGSKKGDGIYSGGGLPSQPDRYYVETDIFPTPVGGRRPDGRLVHGAAGDVYYSPVHYESFVQVRSPGCSCM